MRVYLRKITIPQLQAKCAELKYQCKETLKTEIQTKLFQVLLQGSQTKVEEDDEEADNPIIPENEPNSQNKKSKSEKMCWTGGNCLSFMANIVDQIEYLGALHLLW
jgi:hypothetical protein